MKRNYILFAMLVLFFGFTFPGQDPQIIKVYESFVTPESVVSGSSGVYFVSNIGQFNVKGDGKISKIENDSVTDFVTHLNDPKGLAYRDGNLYAADVNQVWKIDEKGNVHLLADSTSFPVVPVFLNDLVMDKAGNLYVSDTGQFDKDDGAIYVIDPEGKVKTLIDYKMSPEIHSPNGLIIDKNNNLLVIDYGTGKLLEINTRSKKIKVINSETKNGDGLAYDASGTLYISDWDGGGIIYKLGKNNKVEKIMEGIKSPADITIDKEKNLLLIPQLQENKVDIVKL